MKRKNLKNIDVLILCGGLGTRLRSVVKEQPKGLATIGGKPFLEILVNELLRYGFQRFIFCVGYLKEQIIAHFSARNDAMYLFSEEDTPLGTGGAVKNAKHWVESPHVIILNGDSICRIDYTQFYECHLQKQSLLSMVLTSPTKGAEEYGNVVMNAENQILSFQEKTSAKSVGWISAGIYLMLKEGFDFMPAEQTFSLESDFFPQIVNTDFCSGYVVEERFLDIGTPERYQLANDTLR